MSDQQSAPTLRALLFDQSGKDLTRAVVQSLQEEGVTGAAAGGGRHLSQSALRFLHGEITRAGEQALDLDVGDLLLRGWQRHQALTAAARATLAAPGRREVVDLLTHRVVSKHEPYVDVFVDDVRIARVRLDLTVTLEVAGLSGVVAAGRLVELEVGRVTVSATVTVKAVALPPRSRQVDPGVLVRLPHGGLPLLRSADTGGIEPLALQLPWGGHIDLPDHGELVIGRATGAFDSAQSGLELAQVSRRHARFYRAADGVLRVADLGSVNGTYLDGVRLGDTPRPVEVGQQVRFAREVTCLVVHRDRRAEDAVAVPEPRAPNRVARGSSGEFTAR